MFEGYRRWVRRQQAERQRIADKHDARRRAAVARKASDEELLELADDLHTDLQVIDEEIDVRQTLFLLQAARRHQLPVPAIVFPGNQDRSRDWVRSRMTAHCYLTLEAALELRERISKAETEEWQRWTRWQPIISALTGLLGLVVAILALLYKR